MLILCSDWFFSCELKSCLSSPVSIWSSYPYWQLQVCFSLRIVTVIYELIQYRNWCLIGLFWGSQIWKVLTSQMLIFNSFGSLIYEDLTRSPFSCLVFLVNVTRSFFDKFNLFVKWILPCSWDLEVLKCN